jgi:hypothetical protein
VERGQQASFSLQSVVMEFLTDELCERLRAELGADGLVEAHLLRLLALFHTEDAAAQGYGPANVISLLKDLRGHLRDLDLSQLVIRGAYLQDVEMQDANLSGALLQESVLTEAFDGIFACCVDMAGACTGSPGAPMAACWPVAAMTERSSSGTWRVAGLWACCGSISPASGGSPRHNRRRCAP